MVWIQNARIIATLAVIFLHTAAAVVLHAPLGSGNWWVANFIDALFRWCVPVFVMISGALLLDPAREESLRSFYRKRLSRILVPMLFWSAFFLCFSYFRSTVNGKPVELHHLASRVLAGKPHYHLWFVTMIAFLYLIAPFLLRAIRHASPRETRFLIIALMAIAALNSLATGQAHESTLFVNWFLFYLPYFLLGHYVRFQATTLTRPFLWSLFILSVLLTAAGCFTLGAAAGRAAGMYFYSYLSLTVIPMAISAIYLLRPGTTPLLGDRATHRIGALTFGIYLIHPAFLEPIQQQWHFNIMANPGTLIPLTSAVVFALSLGTALMISKIPYLKRTI